MSKKLHIQFQIDVSDFENEGEIPALQLARDFAWNTFFHDAICYIHEQKLVSLSDKQSTPVMLNASKDAYDRKIKAIKQAEESVKYELITYEL